MIPAFCKDLSPWDCMESIEKENHKALLLNLVTGHESSCEVEGDHFWRGYVSEQDVRSPIQVFWKHLDKSCRGKTTVLEQSLCYESEGLATLKKFTEAKARIDDLGTTSSPSKVCQLLKQQHLTGSEIDVASALARAQSTLNIPTRKGTIDCSHVGADQALRGCPSAALSSQVLPDQSFQCIKSAISLLGENPDAFDSYTVSAVGYSYYGAPFFLTRKLKALAASAREWAAFAQLCKNTGSASDCGEKDRNELAKLTAKKDLGSTNQTLLTPNPLYQAQIMKQETPRIYFAGTSVLCELPKPPRSRNPLGVESSVCLPTKNETSPGESAVEQIASCVKILPPNFKGQGKPQDLASGAPDNDEQPAAGSGGGEKPRSGLSEDNIRSSVDQAFDIALRKPGLSSSNRRAIGNLKKKSEQYVQYYKDTTDKLTGVSDEKRAEFVRKNLVAALERIGVPKKEGSPPAEPGNPDLGLPAVGQAVASHQKGDEKLKGAASDVKEVADPNKDDEASLEDPVDPKAVEEEIRRQLSEEKAISAEFGAVAPTDYTPRVRSWREMRANSVLRTPSSSIESELLESTAVLDLNKVIDQAKKPKDIPRQKLRDFRRDVERALADWNKITTPPDDLPESQLRNWAPSPHEMQRFLVHELAPLMERYKLRTSDNLMQITKFGLPKAEKIAGRTIAWPDGKKTTVPAPEEQASSDPSPPVQSRTRKPVMIRTPAQKSEIEFVRALVDENIKNLDSKVPSDQLGLYQQKKQALLDRFNQLTNPGRGKNPPSHAQLEEFIKGDFKNFMDSYIGDRYFHDIELAIRMTRASDESRCA